MKLIMETKEQEKMNSLIELSNLQWKSIVVSTRIEKRKIISIAENLEISIPEVFTVTEIRNGALRYKTIDSLLVLNIEFLVESLLGYPVSVSTCSASIHSPVVVRVGSK